MDFHYFTILKQLLDTGLDFLKATSKKVAPHKAGEFLGNKIADEVTKSNEDKIVKPNENRRNFEEIITKMEHCEISKLLNDSTDIKIFDQKWIEVNDLSSSQYSVNKNIRFKSSMLRSGLCDYTDTYTVLKGNIVLLVAAANESRKSCCV